MRTPEQQHEHEERETREWEALLAKWGEHWVGLDTDGKSKLYTTHEEAERSYALHSRSR